jgi:excinuclease UvrABC ATPase subunit
VPRFGEEREELLQEAELLLQQGFSRLEVNNEIRRIDELLSGEGNGFCKNMTCNIVIDRASVSPMKIIKAGLPIRYRLLFSRAWRLRD